MQSLLDEAISATKLNQLRLADKDKLTILRKTVAKTYVPRTIYHKTRQCVISLRVHAQFKV